MTKSQKIQQSMLDWFEEEHTVAHSVSEEIRIEMLINQYRNWIISESMCAGCDGCCDGRNCRHAEIVSTDITSVVDALLSLGVSVF